MSVEAEIGPRLVAPVLAEYLERYPEVRIDLDLSPRRVDLLAEGFNLALRIGRLPDSGLTVRRLAMLSASLYAAPSYVKRRGKPEHPADLAGHARIHLLHKGDRGEWRLMRGDEVIEVPSNSVLCANNMTMIRHLARFGVGIAVVDDLMASEDVDRGLLQPVLPGWALEPMPLSILTPTRLLAAKTRAFVDLLAQHAVGMVGLSPVTRSDVNSCLNVFLNVSFRARLIRPLPSELGAMQPFLPAGYEGHVSASAWREAAGGPDARRLRRRAAARCAARW